MIDISKTILHKDFSVAFDRFKSLSTHRIITTGRAGGMR